MVCFQQEKDHGWQSHVEASDKSSDSVMTLNTLGLDENTFPNATAHGYHRKEIYAVLNNWLRRERKPREQASTGFEEFRKAIMDYAR